MSEGTLMPACLPLVTWRNSYRFVRGEGIKEERGQKMATAREKVGWERRKIEV